MFQWCVQTRTTLEPSEKCRPMSCQLLGRAFLCCGASNSTVHPVSNKPTKGETSHLKIGARDIMTVTVIIGVFHFSHLPLGASTIFKHWNFVDNRIFCDAHLQIPSKSSREDSGSIRGRRWAVVEYLMRRLHVLHMLV